MNTFVTPLREYVITTAIVVVGLAAVVVPFAVDTSSGLSYLQSRGLTPVTDPIAPSAAPLLFGVVGLGVLLALAGWLVVLPRRSARRLAIVCAATKTFILLGLGAAAVISEATLAPNTDALVGLALLVVSTPLIGAGLLSLAVTLLTRARASGWRIAAAVVDGGVAWSISTLALLEAATLSSPFYTGTARHLIYTPPPNGTWPLVWAGALSLVTLAGTLALVVNAVRPFAPTSVEAGKQTTNTGAGET
jgi:hypothetical protein